ncbi:MAG: DNRLRE domain-containing protein [Clostridia bacterium]|nr:DNRLRE domain-containing protein [Clostridia bacterium]
MKRVLVFCLVFAQVFSASASFAAQTVTAYAPCVANAYTELRAPDDTFGVLDRLQLITSSNSNSKYANTTRDVYLTFDISAYAQTITSAAIRLHCEDVSSKVDRVLSVYAADGEWTEQDVTYANAPQKGALITEYAQPRESSNDFWMEIDVSSYIPQFSGADKVSFIISSSVAATKFSTRHIAGMEPSLKIGFETDKNVYDVTVRRVTESGGYLAPDITLASIEEGAFSYQGAIESVINYRATDFEYDPEVSVTDIIVGSGENIITLVYNDPNTAGANLKTAIVTPTDDTYIKANEADTPFGSEDPEKLQISNTAGAAGAAAIRDGMLKFDISSIDYTHIASCRLVGYLYEGTNTGNRALYVSAVSNEWNEETVTWNNAPAKGELLDEFIIPDSTQLRWFAADITEYARLAEDILSLRLSCDTGANMFVPTESGENYCFALDIRYTDTQVIQTADLNVNYVDANGRAVFTPTQLKDVLCGEYTYQGEVPDIIADADCEYVLENLDRTTQITEGENNMNVLYRLAEDGDIAGSVLDDIFDTDIIGANKVSRDMVLRSESLSGGTITWESSNRAVMSDSGAIRAQEEAVSLKIRARMSLDGVLVWRELPITVLPKTTPSEARLLKYEFEDIDVYSEGEQTYVKDKSGISGDARFMGQSGSIHDGILDLTNNTMTGSRVTPTNSYLIAPDGLTRTMRSYTVMADVKLSDLTQGYRLFAFGAGGNNAVFGRLAPLSAGAKWNAKTTQFTHSEMVLNPNRFYSVAFVYDAFESKASIYVDGVLISSGELTFEACDLIGENTRNYIGRSQWWDTYYDHSAEDNPDFCGIMDNFALYSRALSAQEIAQQSTHMSLGTVVVSDNTVTAEVTEDAYIVCALYADDTLLEVKAQQVNANGAFEASFLQQGDIKIYVLDKAMNMVPLASAQRIK